MITPLSPRAAETWQLLANRAATERDPRLRANLTVVARHVEAEVRGDIPALMATLVAEPRYQVWGASASVGPQGYDEVANFYQAAIRIGKNRLEFEIVRVMVDRDTVLTEGTFRHAYSGAMLTARGYDTVEDDPTGWYLVEYQALIVWPISRDGLIVGEDMYAGEAPRIVRRLDTGELDHLGPVDRG
ncbi:MAG: nuclear transport factor 2 family protein [Rhodococcus sp. (in: high G+C Gram-positive bacteria)]|nr:MAG: nuclear transport factor 2 family protein [Rhodococcus sp. (in: high G+C Gram-positive bacteria)]